MTRLANLRDLGGLPLSGGGSTRTGVLLRSDASYAGDLPPSGVAWPPSTVIDLRAQREWQAHRHDWPDVTTVVRHQLYDGADLSRAAERGGLLAVYDGMLAVASERIAAVVGMLPADGATLVHCAAGKDRTGVVVAALLLAAGVEPAAVVADYRRTEETMPDVLDRLFAVGAVAYEGFREEWAPQAPEEAIMLVVDRLTGWPGGPGQWFVDHGADPDAVQALVRRLAG